MDKIFLFDLDSTITKEEILPTIASEIGEGEAMRSLTESAMMGEMPFRENFTERVKLLGKIPVSTTSKRVAQIQLNEGLVDFIQQNKEQCYIVTSNLDVWIKDLIDNIGMNQHVFCSTANVENDKIIGIQNILDKEDALQNFENNFTIAVGDGSNDYDFLRNANIGIAFGGIRNVGPSLFDICDYAVYTETKLCELLNLIKGNKDAK